MLRDRVLLAVLRSVDPTVRHLDVEVAHEVEEGVGRGVLVLPSEDAAVDVQRVRRGRVRLAGDESEGSGDEGEAHAACYRPLAGMRRQTAERARRKYDRARNGRGLASARSRRGESSARPP